MQEPILFRDDLKSESILFLIFFLLCFFLTLGFALVAWIDQEASEFSQLIRTILFVLLSIGTWFLYWYERQYKLTFTSNRIIIEGMFRKFEVRYADIVDMKFTGHIHTPYHRVVLILGYPKVTIRTKRRDELMEAIQVWRTNNRRTS